MQDQFIVSHNGVETAPMKANDILAKLKNNEFLPVDYVFIEAKQDWIMLADFQEYINKNHPNSTQIPDQAPPPAPYPTLTEEKKKKLLKEEPQGTDLAGRSKASGPVQLVKNSAPEVPVIPKEGFKPGQAAEKEEVTNIQATPPPQENKKSAAIKLQQGEGLYSIPAEKAGEFLVQLKSSSIKADGHLEVRVKSGKPEKVTWEGPSRKVVGQEALFQVFAKDQFDNLVKSYNGEMTLKWQGDVTAPAKVQFKDGIGEIKVSTTKSQTLGFEILASSDLPQLQLPSPATVQFEAGPAEKLILEGPHEVMAGEPVQVKVRAVDKYGNVAKLDTEVEVEVTTRTA